MLDLILRGGAVGTILGLSVVLLVHQRGRAPVSVAVFALLISCYLIVSAPTATDLPTVTRSALIAGATLTPLALTWMMMELLTDRTQSRLPWYALTALALVATVVAAFWNEVGVMRGVLITLLYLGLVLLAILSDRDDLVAARRSFRRGFLAVMALLGVAISVIETTGLDRDLPGWVFPLQAGVFWFLGIVFALWALRPDSTLFLSDAPVLTKPAPPKRPDLINRLNAAMEDGVWQREGLTIGSLAETLGVPEHRLRATINQDLGFRNFATFINGHRVSAAKSMLTDPQKQGTTILEIAYDSGFASLGPFNKAFRAQTGLSPREFRAQNHLIDSENTHRS
jgi:AraC-like DNA-binding protein